LRYAPFRLLFLDENFLAKSLHFALYP